MLFSVYWRFLLQIQFFSRHKIQFLSDMNQKHKNVYIQPRTGETHGLFGVKYLKYHNLRDSDWTAQDLITQYEKLNNIFREIILQIDFFLEINLFFFQAKLIISQIFKKSKKKSTQLKDTKN